MQVSMLACYGWSQCLFMKQGKMNYHAPIIFSSVCSLDTEPMEYSYTHFWQVSLPYLKTFVKPIHRQTQKFIYQVIQESLQLTNTINHGKENEHHTHYTSVISENLQLALSWMEKSWNSGNWNKARMYLIWFVSCIMLESHRRTDTQVTKIKTFKLEMEKLNCAGLPSDLENHILWCVNCNRRLPYYVKWNHLDAVRQMSLVYTLFQKLKYLISHSVSGMMFMWQGGAGS